MLGGRVTTGFWRWVNPVPNAKIEVLDVRTRKLTTVFTAKDGRYNLSLVPGNYRVQAQKPGFKLYPASRVVNLLGDKLNVDFFVWQLPFRNKAW